MILAILVFGLFGTVSELLLLGHDEDPAQFVPIVLIAAGLAVASKLSPRVCIMFPKKPVLCNIEILPYVAGGYE